MILLKLFLSFLQIGLFSVGGGYAAMPLIQAQVVEANGWLTMKEFSDLVVIAEMTPGPIAINAATFVGTGTAGPLGAVAATLGCIFPSLFIVSLLSHIYRKYKNMGVLKSVLSTLRPAVTALIASAGLLILLQVVFSDRARTVGNMDLLGLGLFAAAFFLMRKTKFSPILVMVLCGVTRMIWELSKGLLL